MDAAPSSGRTDAPDAGNVRSETLKWHLAAGSCFAEHETARSETLYCSVLRQGDLLGLQPFGTALHDEGHARAFIEGAIPAGFDGRKMHEHIFAVVALDKSKTFSGVKPLYCTCLFHILSLLLFCYW